MENNLEVEQITKILSQLGDITISIPETQHKKEKSLKQPIENQINQFFVDQTRLNELKLIHSHKFDLVKLVRYCEELNLSVTNECYLATVMLGRAILDHVPPIFSCRSFSEVANNYSGGSKSFKQSMEHLENSTRKIADAHLHVQIRKSEILPNITQVNFSADLDVLLGEIVRLLKTPESLE